MSWIQYAIFIAMMIGAIILHEKFKNSKFLNNNLLKLFTLLIIVFSFRPKYSKEEVTKYARNSMLS